MRLLRAPPDTRARPRNMPSPPPSEPDTQVEPTLAQDSNAPDHLVAVFQEGRYPDGAAATAGFAASRDDGKTWTKDFQQLDVHRIGPARSLGPMTSPKALPALAK